MPFTSIELFKFIKTDINELFDSFLDIFLIMQALLTKFVLLEKKIFTPPSKKLKMKNNLTLMPATNFYNDNFEAVKSIIFVGKICEK